MDEKEHNQIFKAKLELIKKDLEGQIAELGKPADFGSDSDHFEEKTEEAEDFSKNLGIRETFKSRLNDVERALEKITEGTFGICEKCGAEIENDLLRIDPESRYCRQCKIKQ